MRYKNFHIILNNVKFHNYIIEKFSYMELNASETSSPSIKTDCIDNGVRVEKTLGSTWTGDQSRACNRGS